jgi:hypothetical protein
MVETKELPLINIANLGQRLCMTQKENDSGVIRHRPDLCRIQAALVDSTSIP